MPAKLNERLLDHIPPQAVDFGLRAREDYGDIEELAEDIRERGGLISPISVVAKSSLSENELDLMGPTEPEKPYLLIAGGRRTMACLKLDMTSIAAQIFMHPLDELEMRILELHENIKRKNMDFKEETRAKARIHDLMVSEYGEKNSTKPDAPGVSLRDTAEMIGVSPATLSNDRKLAKAFDQYPELEKAETKNDALKLLDKLIKDEALKELRRRAQVKSEEKSTDEEDVRQAIADQYMVGSFFDGVVGVEDGSMSLVEIDPPYAIDLKQQKPEGDTEEYNEIPAAMYPGFMQSTLNEAYRVMAPHSWLIVWFGPDPWFEDIYTWALLAGKPDEVEVGDWINSREGFRGRRLPGIWAKRSGQSMQPTRYLANASEFFFYFQKGDPGILKQGRTNIFEYSPVPSTKKRHPTERPIEMIQDLIQTFIPVGQPILTPFAGSGNTILAAANLGNPAIGWDLSQKYKDLYDVEVMNGPLKKWKSY